MTDDSRPETGHEGNERPGRPTGDGPGAGGGVPGRGDAGRGPAARGPAGAPSLSPERVASIRERIVQGAYDSRTVLRVVARRILGSGDLGL